MAQNIYEDTGYSDPGGMATKASLVWLLNRTLLERQVPSATAAELFGLASDELERLRKGEFRLVSPEQLLAYLRRLGYDIEVRISASSDLGAGELKLSPRHTSIPPFARRRATPAARSSHPQPHNPPVSSTSARPTLHA